MAGLGESARANHAEPQLAIVAHAGMGSDRRPGHVAVRLPDGFKPMIGKESTQPERVQFVFLALNAAGHNRLGNSNVDLHSASQALALGQMPVRHLSWRNVAPS